MSNSPITLRDGLVRPRYYHLSYSFETADAMEPTKTPSDSHGEKTAAEKNKIINPVYNQNDQLGSKSFLLKHMVVKCYALIYQGNMI